MAPPPPPPPPPRRALVPRACCQRSVLLPMSAPEPSDALAPILAAVHAAATAACSSLTASSAALYDRCATFVSTASSPSGRAKISAAAAQVPRAVADDPAKFAVAWALGASVFAAGLVATPRAALLMQLRNADRVRALLFGCAAVTASGAAATASSLCVMQQPSNLTSAMRSRPPSSSDAEFTWIWPPLPSAEVALLCGALSLLTFRLSGGRARYLLPSDLCVTPCLCSVHRLQLGNVTRQAGPRALLSSNRPRLPHRLRV
jgi:hypothetical protein